MQTLKWVFSLFCLFLLFTACHDTTGEIFYAGYTTLKETDSSRLFDTTPGGKASMHYRPVRIDIFYPSVKKPTSLQLSYGDILNMYEQRFDFSTPLDSCKKTSASLAKAIADYLHVDTASKMLAYQTGIFNDFEFPSRKFPLIVYAAGMNGSTWENPVLFRLLAESGYVVAAISSVGKFPGFMSDAVDINEQVQDLLFAIKTAKRLPFIDSSMIGLLSWSLGGTSITKAAMLSDDVKCLLSFDGTEIHYYGFDTAWDNEYRQIMQIAPSEPWRIKAPYLYLSSDHPKNVDSIYNLQQHVSSSDKYFLRLKGAIHEDFSSITTVAKAVQPNDDSVDVSKHQMVCKLSLLFFNQYLKNQRDTLVSDYIQKLVAKSPALYTNESPHK